MGTPDSSKNRALANKKEIVTSCCLYHILDNVDGKAADSFAEILHYQIFCINIW